MNIRRLAIGGGAAVALAAGGMYGVNLFAQREAEAQVEASFARLPPGLHGKHGAVSYSILGDRLTIADVALDAPGQWLTSIRAARIEASGINHGFFGALLSRGWGSGDGGWSVGSIAADAVNYDMAGGYRQSIERIVLNDPRLDLSNGTPMEQWSWAQGIAALSLSSAEATNFHAEAEQQASGVSFTMSVASRSFSGLSAGRLVSVTDKKLAWDATLPQFGKMHVEVAEAHASAVDLLAMEKIANPANYREGERDPTFYTLCGDTGLSQLTATLEGKGPALSISLDGFSMSGIKMRQWPFPPSASPSPPTREQSLALLKSFGLDGLVVDKLAVTSPQIASTSLGLSRFALKLGDKDRVDHAEIAELSVKTPDTGFTLGTFQLDGLTLRLPEGLFTTEPQNWSTLSMPRLFLERYRLADVVFQDKTVGEISLKELTTTMTGDIDKPTGATLEMQGLTVDFAAIARNPMTRMLAGLGYGQVVFEAHGAAAYDTEAKTIDLSRLSFGAPEMGMLSLAYRVGNYPFDLKMAESSAMAQQFMGVAIEGFELRYDDASLAERVLALMAKGSNRPPSEVREGFIAALDQVKRAHAGEPLVADALDTVIGFVREPKSIRVVAKPRQPVTLARLAELQAQPNEMLAALGVAVDRPQ